MSEHARPLFHGTMRPWTVLQHGLHPDATRSAEGGNAKGVHLTTSYRMARTFGAILSVTVPDPDLLFVDELASMDADIWDDWETSFVYPEKIGPEYISITPHEVRVWQGMDESRRMERADGFPVDGAAPPDDALRFR